MGGTSTHHSISPYKLFLVREDKAAKQTWHALTQEEPWR